MSHFNSWCLCEAFAHVPICFKHAPYQNFTCRIKSIKFSESWCFFFFPPYSGERSCQMMTAYKALLSLTVHRLTLLDRVEQRRGTWWKMVKTLMLQESRPKSLYCLCPDPPYCCDDVVTAGEGDGDVSKLAEVPAAKRKGVKRPQPKLDSQR